MENFCTGFTRFDRIYMIILIIMSTPWLAELATGPLFKAS
jgi:hypothetical protein